MVITSSGEVARWLSLPIAVSSGKVVTGLKFHFRSNTVPSVEGIHHLKTSHPTIQVHYLNFLFHLNSSRFSISKKVIFFIFIK